ncbi:MAG: hypothetical protein ABGZ17_31290 [Planctomycetaceae bacterium]
MLQTVHREILQTLGIGLLTLVVGSSICRAAGNQSVHAAEDLTIRFDSRWQGGQFGGYYPVRIEVRNAGPTRTLQFEFRPTHGSGSYAERTVTAEQGAPLKFSLLIPLLGDLTQGEIRVRLPARGRTLLTTTVPLPSPNTDDQSRPSLLIISEDVVDHRNFDTACQSSSMPYGSISHISRAQNIEPQSLPKSWLDYSPLDLVAISWKALGELASAERDALLAWVHTGGTLIVYEIDSADPSFAKLDRILHFDRHAMKGAAWRPIKTGTLANTAAETNTNAGVRANAQPTQLTVAAQEIAESELMHRQLMQGQVYAWQGSPFPGSVMKWQRLLDDLGEQSWSWSRRHGMAPRFGNSEFLNFLIPGIDTVPVYVYMAFITAFTILIGPVNYVWFQRRRQLHYLLITIPALAFLCSMTLLTYSMVSHGFGIQARIRSLTVLDQGSNTAVSTARVAIHAGMLPFQGLNFDRDAAVYPLLPQGQQFESGRVDWTTRQACKSGWLIARAQTQLLSVRHYGQRGHLTIEQESSGALTVANGFAWNLAALAVVGPNGGLYVGGALRAGATTRLLPSEQQPEAIDKLQTLLARYPANFPPNISGASSSLLRSSSDFYRPHNTQLTISLSDSLTERRLQQATEGLRSDGLPWPRSYIAVCQQNPGVSPGIDDLQEQHSNHVILGYY